ncbi:aminoglycoside phosphotransferase family protein [Aestuariibius sp. 2305UL40-4]|uniref:aminoglycoside phosphotransferase family protein n=1 Tax=Aestuariibius violaceus TaxID=3234132 RepID=UPI00345ECDC4
MPLDDLDPDLAEFLTRAGWTAARSQRIAGDASRRSYVRVVRGDGRTALLMDARAEDPAQLRSFLDVAAYLRSAGLSPPEIYESDTDHAFLLIEDFGDALFAREIAAAPDQEGALYGIALDVLLHLRAQPPMPGRATFDPDSAAGICDVAVDWAGGPKAAVLRDDVLSAVRIALSTHAPEASVAALRDFHVENIVLRPGQTGLARAGLLDFQDAVIAHPLYDFVSLITDIRRDVSPAVRVALAHRLSRETGTPPEALSAAIAALSLQRNLRILGVFHRLAQRDGRTGYLRFLPRLHARLRDALADPALAEIAAPIHAAFPAIKEAQK